MRDAPDQDGIRRQRWHNIGPVRLLRTEAAAIAAAQAIIKHCAPGEFQPGEPVLWTVACEIFLERGLKPTRDGTRRTYGSYVRRYLMRAFTEWNREIGRELYVHEVTTQLVQMYVEQHDILIEQRREQGLACTQVRPLFTLLRAMFKFFEARRIAIGDFEPRKVILPRERTIKRPIEGRSYTSDQADRIVAAAKCVRDRALLALLRYLGIRISEALGLTLECIDFNAGYVSIKQAAPCGIVVETKSQRSRRRLAMPPQLAEYLRAWLAQAPATPEAFVFPALNKPGRTWNPSAARRRVIVPLVQELGLPAHLRFHALRHTAAREFVGAGNLADASAALGHQDARLTSQYAEATDAGIRQTVLAAASRRSKPGGQ